MISDEDIRSMLNDCLSALRIPRSRGGPGFNDWEVQFVESVSEQFDDGRILTDKQIDKLETLWNRI